MLVSWLPLYHDMGLVGLLTLPMTTGTALVLGAPQDFTPGPARWMEWLSTYGGTATAGPNFCYVLATRALNRADQLDLSRLRIALNGAEPIDPDQVEAFVEAGARHGLRPGAVFPAFGMAEVAIAGTFPEPMARHAPPTASTGGCSRPSATRPRSSPAPTAAAASPCWAARSPASRSASSTPRPATRCATARSASSRSAARR